MSDYSHQTYRNERQIPNEKSRLAAASNRRRWTDDDDAIIREFWVNVAADGRDGAEVARALGRTIEACANRAHKIRVQDGTADEHAVKRGAAEGILRPYDDDSDNGEAWYVR